MTEALPSQPTPESDESKRVASKETKNEFRRAAEALVPPITTEDERTGGNIESYSYGGKTIEVMFCPNPESNRDLLADEWGMYAYLRIVERAEKGRRITTYFIRKDASLTADIKTVISPLTEKEALEEFYRKERERSELEKNEAMYRALENDARSARAQAEGRESGATLATETELKAAVAIMHELLKRKREQQKNNP